MLRFVRAVSLVLLTLPWMNGCAHTAPVAVPVVPLRLTLAVSPKTGFAPLYVLATVRAIDEAGVLECPQFNLTWGIDGEPGDSSSFPGESCWAGGPRVQAPRPRLLSLHRPGEYLIVASMADHGVALSDTARVQVIGRTEE